MITSPIGNYYSFSLTLIHPAIQVLILRLNPDQKIDLTRYASTRIMTPNWICMLFYVIVASLYTKVPMF